MDTEYPLESFKNYIGKFVAPKTGTVTCNSTTTDAFYPYVADLDDMNANGNAIDVTMNSLYGQKSYDFKVEEGKTYYMYINFVMNDGTVCKLSMAENQSINLVATSPSDGVFNVSNSGQIAFDFDKAVSVTGAAITCNGVSKRISPSVNVAGVFFEVKSIIWGWYNDGTAKAGDKFTVKMTGVCMASNKDVLYNGTGVLEAEFTLGEKPITLLREENTSGSFLSYYTKNDDSGIIRLTFSGPVKEGATAVLKYGNIDQDSDGEYYTESLPVTVEGNTVSVNLQEKRRRPIDMVSSGTNYSQVVVGITGVFDTNGNYAFSTGDGSLGSYWYSYTLKEVTANVVAEFTPASGSDISKTKNLEIWITDEKKLSYSGVEFVYEKDGTTSSVVVTDIKKEQDPDDATAMILSVPVPAELSGAKNISLSFKDLQCADGSDYSNVLRARYNSFIISRTTPVANGTFELLTTEQSLKVFSNMDASVTKLTVEIKDLNPAEGDDVILFEGDATADTKGFVFSLPRNIRLEKGHDYSLTAYAYNEDGLIGSDYVIYHGAADVFRYSDVVISSITPSSEDVKLSNETVANPFHITYDGLVKMDEESYIMIDNGSVVAFKTMEAVNPDEEGYATEWTLTMPDDILKVTKDSITFHIVATDIDGRRVQGNTDKKDYSYTAVVYKVANATSISGVSSESNKSLMYNINGVRTNKSNGIIINNGKKYYHY